jgi:hypothetical protein
MATPDVLFSCPFCGRSAVAGEAVDHGQPGVHHAEPHCPRFDQLDPRVYLSIATNKAAAQVQAEQRRQKRRETVGVMGYAAGGAVAGFMVGGPVGAAIGGLFAAAVRRVNK